LAICCESHNPARVGHHLCSTTALRSRAECGAMCVTAPWIRDLHGPIMTVMNLATSVEKIMAKANEFVTIFFKKYAIIQVAPSETTFLSHH
jgi:hypothetical protein